MIRQVVNLVVQNIPTGVHSVHRIDPYKHLFYRSAAEAAAAANANKGVDRAVRMQTLALPDPAVRFAPSPTCLGPYRSGLDLFALLGTRGSEGRIVSTNVVGEAVLYDADERLFLNLPWINAPTGLDPVCISVALPGAAENSLYLMETRTGVAMQQSLFGGVQGHGHTPSCFVVLEYGPWHGGEEVWDMNPGWHWRALPPPPFVLRRGHVPSYITSYATTVNANGCSAIYVSWEGKGIGTYCFDTSRHVEEWRHVGDWTMPVRWGAKYVPEFDLWFGFSAHSPKFHLCALDLSAMAQDQQQPVVQYVFEDLNAPTEEDWGLMTAELVSLGAGKFCVAKSFEAADYTQFAVLTGIEIVRGDDHGLHMVRHKCTCYYFVEDAIKCVL